METKIKVNTLPITEDVANRINNSISSYRASGIEIEIVEFDGLTASVLISQSNLVNGYILSNKQLYDRAREIFSEVIGIKVKIIPSVFSLNVSDINIQWIEQRMDEFGLNRKDLIKQLALDKSYISLLFAEPTNKRKVSLSKPMKATFFYYFLTYELNRDFRNQ